VFDPASAGLTVVRRYLNFCRTKNIFYSVTRHRPTATKSAETVERYSSSSPEFDARGELIVVALHTVSSVAIQN